MSKKNKKNYWNFALLLVALICLNLSAVYATNCGLCESTIDATVNITVSFPILLVNKSITPEKFEQDDLVEFKIEVLNLGTAPAYRLSIVDDISEHFDYVQSFYHNFSTKYLIYRYVFNATGSGKYECQNSKGQWTTNYTNCVPNDNIEFHVINNKLTWGKFGFSSDNKELPAKTAFAIKFYARAKENSSTGTFTNNLTVKANYERYQYICDDKPTECLGGTCSFCSSDKVWYCDNCASPPTPSGICESTEIDISHYVRLNLSITPKLNASVNFTIINKTEISLTKKINSTYNKFAVNEIIEFILNINTNLNLTNATLINVEIIDELPYGVKFLNATLCNETKLNLTTIPRLNKTNINGADVLNFYLPNMTKIYSNITICINAIVTENAINPLKNKARVQAKHIRYYETKILNASDDVLFFALKKADIKISKRTLTPTVLPNSSATFEIVVWNEGHSDAVNISIFDFLSCNFIYINDSCNVIKNTGGGNLTCPNKDTQDVSFNISKLKEHSKIVFTFKVYVPSNASGICENMIVAEAKDALGNNISIDYISRISYVYIEVGFGYLQVNKEILNNRLFAVGDVITYKIKVRNSGILQAISDVLLTDYFPLKMRFENITLYNESTGSNVTIGCNRSNVSGTPNTGEILKCSVGNLAPGETKIYFINARVMNYSSVMVNEVEVSGAANGRKQWFKHSVAAYLGKPKLKITKSGALTIKPGDEIRYTLTIKNDGDAPAYNVSVTDILPINWSILSWRVNCYDQYGNMTGNGTDAMNVTVIINILSFTKDKLNPGHYCVINYSVRIPEDGRPGIYTNDAIVTGKDFLDNDIEGDSAKLYSVVLSYPNFLVTKTANTTYADIGDKVRFTIVLQNVGNVPLTMNIRDILPHGFVNTTQAIFNETIYPGNITTKTVDVIITKNASYGLNINIVEVNAVASTGEIIQRSGIAYLYITSPEIEIYKRAEKTTYNPKDTVKFYIKIKNVGNSIARNITLTEFSQLENFTIIDENCSSLNFGKYPNIIISGELAPNKECYIIYTKQIPEGKCGLITNDVNISYIRGNETYTRSYRETIFVNSVPSLFVGLVPSNNYIDQGDVENWTIVVKNNGNINLAINLTNKIPRGLINLSPIFFSTNLSPGDVKTMNVFTRADEDGVIENVVNVVAVSSCGEYIEKDVKATINVGKPLVLINKWTDTPMRLPGEKATFYIMIKNDGSGKATNVTVIDSSNLTNASIINVYAGNCTTLNIGTYPNIITNGTLYPNQYCILTYNMSVTDVGGFTNIATLYAKSGAGKDIGPEKATASVNVGGVVSISVEKECNVSESEIGSYVLFTVKVKNIGNVLVTIDSMNETLPKGFKCNMSNWSIIDILPNKVAERNISCLIKSDAVEGLNVNEVRVTARSAEGVMVSQSDNAFVIVRKPMLKIEKYGPSVVKPGARISYFSIIKNTGDATIYNVSVMDILPINWSIPAEWYMVTCYDQYGKLTGKGDDAMKGNYTMRRIFDRDVRFFLNFTRGKLDPGHYCKIFYSVNIPPYEKSGVYKNRVVGTGKDKLGKDINRDMDDEDEVTTLVIDFPSFYLEIFPNKTYARKGEIIKFLVKINNIGDAILHGNMSVILPPGFENLSPASFSFISHPKTIARKEVTAKVLNETNRTIDGAHLAKAIAIATLPDGRSIEESAYCAVYVTSTSLSIVADVDDKAIYENSTIIFRDMVINPSMFDAFYVNITHTIPAGFEYVKNSTVVDGVPYEDPQIITTNNNTKLKWDNFMIYAKSLKVIKFKVIAKNVSVGTYTFSALLEYNLHDEIQTANTTFTLEVLPKWKYVKILQKPNIFVFNDELFDTNKRIMKYNVVILNDFNEIENKDIGIKISNTEILSINVNSIPLSSINFTNISSDGYINISKIVKLLKMLGVSTEKVNIEFVVKPNLKFAKIIDTFKFYVGNESYIYEIVSYVLFPPDGIIVSKGSNTSNINITYVLKNSMLNYTLELKKGWNLIGLPFVSNSTDLRKILGPIEGKYTDVFVYENGWKYKSRYLDKWFGDLGTIEPCKGYWIKVNEDVNLTLQGYEVKSVSINLHKGWNLISLPTLENIGVNEINRKFDYTDIFGYKNDKKEWIYKSRYTNIWFGELENMEPGKGYWVRVEEFENIRINF